MHRLALLSLHLSAASPPPPECGGQLSRGDVQGLQATFDAKSAAKPPKGSAPRAQTEEEKRARVELAAAYRLAKEEGWDEIIYNHISYRLDDDGSGVDKFLLNPYGLGFDEVTASSLVLIDSNGTVLDPGSATGRVNVAGFVIHSAVHAARPEVKCVIHSHQEDTVAIGARKEGLLPVGQAYYALGQVTYHSYEGLAVLDGEKETLARDLGKKSMVMLLRNHGALALGRSVGEAYVRHFYLVRACKQQVKASSAQSAAAAGNGGAELILPEGKVRSLANTQAENFNKGGLGDIEFQYLMRNLEKRVGSEWKF